MRVSGGVMVRQIEGRDRVRVRVKDGQSKG
jgi:hypothetical protein